MRGEEAYEALVHAFRQVGYRHVDTARYYRNESQVGRAIRDCGVPREHLYATTKLFSNDMGGGEKSKRAYEDSLKQSGLDYWDLVLLHAPDGGKDFRLRTWSTLSEFVKQGKIRSLGVSNFGVHHIEELVGSNEGQAVKPVVNQIECHPFFAQKDVRKACEDNGIAVQAYCPLARGHYYGDKTLSKVAERNDKTEAQVMLRWLLQHGIVPLPKSSNEKRQVENAQSLDFELSSDDMRGKSDEPSLLTSTEHIIYRPLRTGLARPGQSRIHRIADHESECALRDRSIDRLCTFGVVVRITLDSMLIQVVVLAFTFCP